MKQQRAARTRESLLRAAASEFDRWGYDGTSLARVSRTAGISMGALTFHFSSKAELAEAVQDAGNRITRSRVEKSVTFGSSPMGTAVALSLAIVHLLEEDVSVRAAARLARERPHVPSADWTPTWVPALGAQVQEAADEYLRTDVEPTTLVAMVVLLITGSEAAIRRRLYARRDECDHTTDAARLLTRIWQAVLTGVTRDQG